MTPALTADSRAREWLRRADTCWTSFATIRTYYQRLAEVFYPERQDFTTRRTWGVERYEAIYDSEPIRLRWELANAIGAMMRPRGVEWFKLTSEPEEVMEDNQPVLEWLEHATKRQRDLMYRRQANFALAMAQSDNDYVTFGSAIVRRAFTADTRGLSFTCVHPRDIVWEEGPEGRPDTTYEQIEKPARFWKEMLRKDCPADILKACETGKDHMRPFSLWRTIAPASEHEWRTRPPRDAAYASLYLYRGDQEQIVAENWLRVMPYHIRRWMTVSGEPAGRSPCTSIALADSRTLNEAQRALLEGLEKAIDPPMAASDKIVGNEVVLRAGGIVYVEDVDDVRKAISPIQEQARLDYGMEFTAERRSALSRAFLQNVLKLPQDHTMTAYEVGERLEEFVRSAAPVFEPMEADNSELCEGIFSLLLHEFDNRQGAFLPPPEELQDADVKFEFETPMVDAQRKREVAKVRELHAVVSEAAQLYPDAPKHVRWDKAMDIVLRAFPAKLRKPYEEVAAEMEQQELVQGGQRALELAATARPEVLQAGLEMLGGGDPLDAEYEEAAPAQPQAALPAPVPPRR